MVVARVDMVCEEIKNLIGLGLFELGKSSNKARIDIECLQPSHRMGSHRRVVGVDGCSICLRLPEIEDSVI